MNRDEMLIEKCLEYVRDDYIAGLDETRELWSDADIRRIDKILDLYSQKRSKKIRLKI